MTPQEILQAFREGGELSYEGEGITQLQHGWQCGQLAAAAGASPALQLAAWLHDLGHMLSGLEGSPTTRGIDDGHERIASDLLRAPFGLSVSEPIALHVRAKRYLVAMYPDYKARLSPDATRSLALQGGPMSIAEATAFRAEPFHDDALRVRTWDDLGKRREWQPASTEAALQDLNLLMRRVLAKQASHSAEPGREFA